METRNKNLLIIALIGMIFGMIMKSPTFFVGGIVMSGLVCGGLFTLVAYFVTKKKDEVKSF